MECLRRNDFQSGACRELSMAYLQCRMERQVPGGSPFPPAPPRRTLVFVGVSPFWH